MRPHKITKVAMEWANPQDNIVYLLDEYNTAEVYYINRKFSDSNFTELNIPDTINVKGRKYTVTTIGSRALQGLESLKKIHFPKELNTIKSFAFYGCGVEEIIIDSWLTCIERLALSGCDYLRRLHIKTTEGIEKLKGTTIGKEDTIIVSSSPEAYKFNLYDLCKLPYSDKYYSSEELSKGIKPHITLVLDGTVSFDRSGLFKNRDFESISLEPKVTIVLNKSKVEITLDSFNHDDSIFDKIVVSTKGLEILTSQKGHDFSMVFKQQEISDEEISLNGISDFSDFNFIE